MNRFRYALKLNGFPIEKAEEKLVELKQNFLKNRSGFVEHHKWEIFNYHLERNPFYQKFAGHRNIKKWEDIPVLTKQDLQTPLKNRLSKGFKEKEIFINKTSGSSGHPFIFAKDKFAHALSWAHILDLYQQYDILIGKSLEARFYGIQKDFIEYKKERLKDKMAKRYRFDIFDLSDENLSKFLKIFRQKPFEYINGYTSAIVVFAKFLENQNVTLKDVCPSLKICITTSEMLFDSDRKLLEKQFGIPIINEYGAAEFGVLAFENKDKQWCLNQEIVYIEVIDDDGIVLKNGKEGHIVITSFFNKAHPFIRYKIGDIGKLNFTDIRQLILDKLIGRTNIFAHLPSGKKVPALSFYYVTKSVIEANSNVKEIKVIQKTLDSFLIKYVAEDCLSPSDETKILKAIEKYLEFGLNIKFQQNEYLERTERGKLRQFESDL